MSIEEIIAALLVANTADYPAIKKYVAWVMFRRRMYNEFFLSAHWIRPEEKYHWVGN
jgi:hypothetical protein